MTNKKRIPVNQKIHQASIKRGRSKDLIRRRNIRLITRFYEMTEVDRVRFDDVIRRLSEDEFFISEFRIWIIVRSHLDLLDALKRGENIDK